MTKERLLKHISEVVAGDRILVNDYEVNATSGAYMTKTDNGREWNFESGDDYYYASDFEGGMVEVSPAQVKTPKEMKAKCRKGCPNLRPGAFPDLLQCAGDGCCIIEQSENICPVCGGSLKYDRPEVCEHSVSLDWVCGVCGQTGTECHQMEFVGHSLEHIDEGAVPKMIEPLVYGKVTIVPQSDWEILKKYIGESFGIEGIVLISEKVYNGLSIEVKEQLGAGAGDSYDFGGECDVMVDIVTGPGHYFVDSLSERVVSL